ncbi:phosphoribosylanthranilate isomerase [Candidatus Woesearchaeota archaeon]|nr:phosphoribosylanthranilate isomerase [Candidatus Woesearchaeota archaeon]
MTLVKICGVTNLEDGLYAKSRGANFIGINFVSPTGRRGGSPRYIFSYIPKPEEVYRNMISKLTRVKIIGVFVNEDPEEIKRIVPILGLDGLQLHGDEDVGYCKDLRSSPDLKDIEIWNVYRMKDKKSLEKIKEGHESEYIDKIMADAYVPRQRGGTGTQVDRSLGLEARAIVIHKPFILAGGLKAWNIEEAILDYTPDVVDVSSGVEAYPGKKSSRKVHAFINNANHPEIIKKLRVNSGYNLALEHINEFAERLKLVS